MPRMKPFVPALTLMVGFALVWHTRSQSRMPLREPLESILPSVPGYRAQSQKLTDDERSVAGMTNYVARVFWRDSVPMFTTLVSYYESQAQGRTIHSPRNCLPGAGWEVLRPGTKALQLADGPHLVNHYTLKNGAQTAIVYYWYQGRGRIVADEYAVKWNLLRDAALRGRTEEALVRVVIPVEPGKDDATAKANMADADSLGASIATMLAAQVSQALPDAHTKPIA